MSFFILNSCLTCEVCVQFPANNDEHNNRRLSNGDSAKRQSWMSPLEFKRVAFSNEIQFEVDRTRVDGNMIKRMASGGDTVEVRTNFKDEVRKKLQSTMFLCCNDFPPVSPEDAYSTLEVFKFGTTFVDRKEMEERGEACPAHWAAKDDSIKQWIKQPDVIDAFTLLVLSHYKSERQYIPVSVKADTAMFKGPVGVQAIDRVAEIVKHEESETSIVFIDEIKIAMQDAGFAKISSQQISTHIQQLYGRLSCPPLYGQYTKEGKRSHGFNRIRLETVTGFDAGREVRNKRFAERMELCHDIRKKAALVQ